MSFKKHELGWVDEETGLLWHNEVRGKITRYEAEAWALGQGLQIPTQAQFIEAERHGIRRCEGLNWEGWFWSSTPYPGSPDSAFIFNGGNGYADVNVNRGDGYYYVDARCVSPVGSAPGVSVDSKLSSLAEHKSEAVKLLRQAIELLEKS